MRMSRAWVRWGCIPPMPASRTIKSARPLEDSNGELDNIHRRVIVLEIGTNNIAILGVTFYLLRPSKPPPSHVCVACGYNLTGNTSGTCPECGSPIPPTNKESPRPA